MILNFSVVIPGKLAASGEPGSTGDLGAELDFARAQGIGAVVSLTERGLPKRTVSKHHLEHLHLPVVDYTPPSLEQIRTFVEFVDRADRAVLVHCRAGIGRTGTMVGAYLVSRGATAKDAIQTVRRMRPGSIETRAQEGILREWEETLRAEKEGG
jgi:atypical dual specificity phosphatase